ncbi:MAG: tRNA 2-thiouridine(34) synthase MnmA [Kiritimatiellae bacterium]|nr:tRNA 2-thiouridine(34) synthase MnmA [Kiritimatiellia bacterium]
MKVALGISGGIDSTAAALLLKEQGADVHGVYMKVGHPNEEISLSKAIEAADRLHLPLEVFDLTTEFAAYVINYIKEEYPAGRTPNPCVRCNEFIKLGLLPRISKERLGCEMFATGHYAQVKNGPKGPRLFKGIDPSKDQSYFLYRVSREVLSKVIFPLGAMYKKDVRKYASLKGFEKLAADSESQDFCFGDVKSLIDKTCMPGPITTRDGTKIAEHKGVSLYTVGMRRGLGIGGGGKVFYVTGIEGNTIIVGPKQECIAYDVVLKDEIGDTSRAHKVKVRSTGEGRLFSEGVFAVAPGQSAVFYNGDEVVGGGIIVRPIFKNDD